MVRHRPRSTPSRQRLTLAASITPAAIAFDTPSTTRPAERTKISGRAPSPVAKAVTRAAKNTVTRFGSTAVTLFTTVVALHS
jgi:hypothetical protein